MAAVHIVSGVPFDPQQPEEPTTTPFRSYFLGGFESATHGRRDGCRVDCIASSHHDVYAERDYSLLAEAGVRTVRDALRWHHIEPTPGAYTWDSLMPMLDAAHATGTEVLWDLCHWGVPDWVDPFSPEFPAVFARYAEAALRVLLGSHLRHGIAEPPTVCPINEMSFWSWVGGDVEHFFPLERGRGHELKRQLARASNAAIRAMRELCPAVRIVQPEPTIHIAPNPERPDEAGHAVGHTLAQYQAWDMLLGRMDPELGGAEDHIDVLGVNYYWNNQWIHGGEKAPVGHPLHRPLHLLLREIWERYGKPLFLSETSAEGEAGPGWLAYIMAEVRQAEQMGVPVAGVCIYPVMDYVGWDDDRHCPVGLITTDHAMQGRTLNPAMLAELRIQQRIRRLPDAAVAPESVQMAETACC